MKIYVRSNSQLEINLPQSLARLVGFFFILIGSTMVFFLFQDFELQCLQKAKSQANQCQLMTTYAFLYQDKMAVGSIKKAKMYARKNNKGGWNYSVVLLTDQGKILLSDESSPSKVQSQRAVDQINDYLQNSEKTLRVASIQPLWLKFFILIFPCVGVCLFVLTKHVRVLFNKTTNQLKIIRENIFQQKEEHYPLNKIKDVVIQEERSPKGILQYRVALILEDKSVIPLTAVHDSLLTPKIRMAKAINDFLGLNLNFDVAIKKEKKQSKLAHALFIFGLLIIVMVYLFSKH